MICWNFSLFEVRLTKGMSSVQFVLRHSDKFVKVGLLVREEGLSMKLFKLVQAAGSTCVTRVLFGESVQGNYGVSFLSHLTVAT